MQRPVLIRGKNRDREFQHSSCFRVTANKVNQIDKFYIKVYIVFICIVVWIKVYISNNMFKKYFQTSKTGIQVYVDLKNESQNAKLQA